MFGLVTLFDLIWVNIGSENGTKPLPEPMLTHQCGLGCLTQANFTGSAQEINA